MFLHQALLDNTFGISGEKILSNVSSTIGKLFRYQNQLCALYSVGNSIVINNIDLSQNVLTFNYSSPTQINDVYIDSNTLYFCGKVETQNVGFYNWVMQGAPQLIKSQKKNKDKTWMFGSSKLLTRTESKDQTSYYSSGEVAGVRDAAAG